MDEYIKAQRNGNINTAELRLKSNYKNAYE